MRTAIAAAAMLGLLAQAGRRPVVELPAESAGWDRVLGGLLSVFNGADVLALGEAHNRKVDSDFRLRLIRHPEFVTTVRTIVVETSGDQRLLDRYVRAESMSADDLQRLWAQQPSALFKELVETVRDLNQKLPSKPLMILFSPQARQGQDRSALTAAMIRDRVGAGDKTLVIYGSGHTWHREGGLTRALERGMQRVFVAEVLAPALIRGGGPERQALDTSLKELEDTLSSRDRPVLVSLRSTRAAALGASPFYLGQAMLPPGTTIGDLDDACVFFGRAPELGTFVGGR